MDKLSILFIVKAEQVAGAYNHYWILYKYGMLECRKDVMQCSRKLLIRLVGLMLLRALGCRVFIIKDLKSIQCY